MKFVADFHIHSKYSRATSKDMDLESLDRWANIKGIRVLGAGDFTHPEWFRILKEKLGPAEPGFFTLKSRITNHKTNNKKNKKGKKWRAGGERFCALNSFKEFCRQTRCLKCLI